MLIFRYPDPGIPDRKNDLLISCTLICNNKDIKIYPPLFGKLHGVGEQIPENLLETQLICDNIRRAIIVNRYRKIEAFLRRYWFKKIADTGHEIFQVSLFQRELHLSGFYLREVKDLIDKAEQIFAGLLNNIDIFLLVFGKSIAVW